MAQHWSSGLYVLAWSDPSSDGRMRFSWGTRERCESIASTMDERHDPKMYGPLSGPVIIRKVEETVGRTLRPEPEKPKKRKRKHVGVSATE